MAGRWFDSLDEVLSFTRALDRAHELDGIEAALAIVERPWRWDTEYTAWVQAGRPDAFDLPIVGGADEETAA